jgi:hypothetical protein
MEIDNLDLDGILGTFDSKTSSMLLGKKIAWTIFLKYNHRMWNLQEGMITLSNAKDKQICNLF